MTKKNDDRTLGRLLAGRNEPSVLEKEAGFEKVLEDVQGPRPKRRWPAFSMVVAGATALLALFVVLPTTPEFVPRGGEEPVFRARCVMSGQPSACRPGARLGFEVRPPEGAAYMAVFALRPDGAAIWYVPSEAGRAEKLTADLGVFPRGFEIDEQHPPGRYRLHAVFSSQAMSRQELEKMLGDDLESDDLIVLKRLLEVEGAPSP